MKKILLALASLYCLSVSAQEPKEIKVKTDVSEVTVFIDGAQIVRSKTLDVTAGKSQLVFTNLSPYIDPKSVQVKVNGEVMVTSVNHQMSYVDTTKTKKSVDGLVRLDEIDEQLKLEKSNKAVVVSERQFLDDNRKIGGVNNGVNLLTLKESAIYYRDRMASLNKQEIAIDKKISDLGLERNQLINEISQGGGSKKMPIGEVVVDIDSKKIGRATFELSYYVKNAGWFPTYDIRATSIEQPIELLYKANVHQNTKEDWKNVKLKVSSSNPTLDNVAPQLKTYYLNYYTQAPRYTTQTADNQVTGVVVDESGEGLIGVTVSFSGTTIGTVTDLDGRFSLAIPQNAQAIDISYIGYKRVSLPVSRTFMTVKMEEENNLLSEVVVSGYASQALTGRLAGISVSKQKESKNDIKIRGISSTPMPTSIAMPTAQVETPTAVEFEIKMPYTIKSDNKNTMIEVDRYVLPAQYEYFSIPKVNTDAFLLANVVDWEKYNLLEGEANIFFENTYIGKTILDVRNVSDTLSLSLGRDKNVSVKRELSKEYTSKKFLGSKKEEIRAWKIAVRNNKKQPINIIVLDQIPVSTTQEIEVEKVQLNGGQLNDQTGEVKWKLDLAPSDKKDLDLQYKVKYPKSRTLTIE